MTMSIEGQGAAKGFYEVLRTLWAHGEQVSPRGLRCRELLNFSYNLPPRARFMNFHGRGLKLDYIKQEFLWYIRGDKRDVSIRHVAKMWDGLINIDKTLNSNYGQYIFCPGERGYSNFDRVAYTLMSDPFSRRAVITILNNDHLEQVTDDFPCTGYLNFVIRENTLIMMVRMRSQDAIYGMGNDVPCFSFIHELLLYRLKMISGEQFKDLRLGKYMHMADSFHVYERHYEMVEKILSQPMIKIDEHALCPPMTINTHAGLQMLNTYLDGPRKEVAQFTDPFTAWIHKRDDDETLVGVEYL